MDFTELFYYHPCDLHYSISDENSYINVAVISERFLFSGSSLELLFDEFPVVTEDDFLSLCSIGSIGGTVKLSVVIPDDDDTSNDNLNNNKNDEAIIDNVTDDLDPDANNTAFQENARDAETLHYFFVSKNANRFVI
uniref:Uncharacterized protein n=1 Tax=Daphnia galeata TaxID=27404 RepID=A0A8J2WRH0_9CRUS|nr:unnamed protein product [Daphnia galeata]